MIKFYGIKNLNEALGRPFLTLCISNVDGVNPFGVNSHNCVRERPLQYSRAIQTTAATRQGLLIFRTVEVQHLMHDALRGTVRWAVPSLVFTAAVTASLYFFAGPGQMTKALTSLTPFLPYLIRLNTPDVALSAHHAIVDVPLRGLQCVEPHPQGS